MRASAHEWAEARAALTLGRTITEWDDLDDMDRDWAVAAVITPGEPDTCTVCGGPAAVCQDHDAQHAWVIEATRCYKTRAISEYLERVAKTDKHASTLHLTARIDPKRRKSVRAGGVTGG